MTTDPTAAPATFLYFAYGSNLLTRRLRERTPSARKVGVGVLRQHTLRWHKAATDGSGKCDVVPCSHDGADSAAADGEVHGVVWEIDRCDKPALDAAETLGVGYGERELDVEMDDGRLLRAWAYIALKTDAGSVPYDWYHALVLAGAREQALPPAYLSRLEAVLTKVDEDRSRSQRHFGLTSPTEP
ncbi:MAG: gamma-glutamylcyclotransferase family protein [Rubrivivax sp.]